MKKYNILNLESYNYSKVAKNVLQKVGRYFDENQVVKKGNIEVIICRFKYKLDKNFLKKFKNLKYILTNTTGLNHIDIGYCKIKNIKVFSLRNQKKFLKNVTSTAELYLGLILSLYRSIPNAISDVKKSKWDRNKFLGNNLSKKNIGIFGLGRNGLLLAKYCKALDMNVTFFDKNKKSKIYKKIRNLKSFLGNLDILAICINYSEGNHALIDRHFLNLMPKHSILVNCARGELINEKDLLRHLQKKKFRGAALDVVSEENSLNNKKNILIEYSKKNNNLIITPHIGGATKDSWKMTEEYLAKMFFKYVKKK